MRQIKSIFFFLVIVLTTGCGKAKHDINPLILGDWKLIEIYGEKPDHKLGWMINIDSPIQTIKFSSNGEYALSADGNPICTGIFLFEGSNSIKLSPSGCMPLMESMETIYVLKQDTLIISNQSNSISSFNLRRDKYLKVN